MAKIVTISEAASLAIHAMVLIARSGKSVNVNVIAQQMGASRNHLAKVMQRLVKDGFVKSTRGPAGGFVLNRPPEDITLLSIYESIEGTIELSGCPLDHKVCAMGQCLMEGVIEEATRLVINHFSGKKLSDLL
ncbi:MAG: RrF2 family transcriptional regulator [Bacteroidales bacterium]